MPRRSSQAVDWVSLCRKWRGSGLTQSEFCRRLDLPLHTFRRRLYHRESGDEAGCVCPPGSTAGPPTRDPSPGFIPVRVVPDERPESSSAVPSIHGRPVEVILDCGRRVVVPPGFDPETLRQVVGILERRGC